MTTRTPPDSLAGRDRWEWIRPFLLVASATGPIVCTILALTDRSTTTAEKLIGAGLSVVYVIWSLAMSRPLTNDWDCDRLRWPAVYLLGAYALFAGMVLTNPYYFFLAFLLYWYTFAVFPMRWAIVFAVGFSVEMVALQLTSGEGLSQNPGALISAGVSVAFGIVLAVWIGGIIDQSKQRAQLIADLEQTRAALAGVNHEAGVLAERERIAHEIHDTLAQGFTSIVMLSQAADTAIDTDAQAAHRHVGSIERTARENLAEARHLVEGMGPAALQDDSLVEALGRLTERLAGDLGIDARTEVDGRPRPLSSVAEVALLRAAQEAVANVRKHADATHVVLTLDFGRDGDPTVLLAVTDDGRGFDPELVTGGFGLAGMRQRMEKAGGELEVDSALGQGTTVKVRLP